jgi:hypothetical protein
VAADEPVARPHGDRMHNGHRRADMTLQHARELITQQLQFGGGYNRNAVRLLLGEVQREHGQAAVDGLIRELDLEQAFGLKPGTDFAKVGR